MIGIDLTCSRCGWPIFGAVYSDPSGNLCHMECPKRYPAHPHTSAPEAPLTEADVRRIVGEELGRMG